MAGNDFGERRMGSLMGELAEMVSDLQKRSGGGNDGGMESRLSRLEKQFDTLQSEVSKGFLSNSERFAAVEQRLAKVETHIAHLPSKGFIVTALGTSIAILGGLVMIAARFGLLAAN